MKNFDAFDLIEKLDDIELIKKLPNTYIEEKTVLGIDIYKYSQYPEVQQNFIPVLFECLYRFTLNAILEHEAFLFNDYAKSQDDFKKKFISTGDGGFQIFDNPLQAVVFATLFQANVKRYCSGGSAHAVAKKLYQIVDKIELRYAITLDEIFFYNDNYFGPAIINNARILSKDTLNRMLIDANTVDWFAKGINGIENLTDIDKETLLKTSAFSGATKKLESTIFGDKDSFQIVNLLKVGRIKAKTSELDIFNLHLQSLLYLDVDHHDYNTYVVTLGNLNTSGIE